MEIRDIIIIIMFIQLVIVSCMCVNEAKKDLELIELIKTVDELHNAKEDAIIKIIKNEK